MKTRVRTAQRALLHVLPPHHPHPPANQSGRVPDPRRRGGAGGVHFRPLRRLQVQRVRLQGACTDHMNPPTPPFRPSTSLRDAPLAPPPAPAVDFVPSKNHKKEI
eukprot:1194507-Prorocentrum_minimum.AAC.2